MKTTVEVTRTVEVEVDESKFTPDFMAEFRHYFYGFTTIQDHIEHLAQLFAREVVSDTSFIEGYGPASEMGIKFHDRGMECRSSMSRTMGTSE